MSHISRIELEIKDLEALKCACRRLGLEFLHGKDSFRWYSGTHDCDHAISVPEAQYEIGVLHKSDNYELIWDDWNAGGLTQKLGPGAGLLKQSYAVERVLAESRRRNMRVSESRTDNGIRLVLAN